jgi:hypothetical protein
MINNPVIPAEERFRDYCAILDVLPPWWQKLLEGDSL